jgi:hypothetical protein
MKPKLTYATLVDVAAFAVLAWYSLPPSDRHEIKAGLLLGVTEVARSGAATLGRLAITAEARYWKVVRS